MKPVFVDTSGWMMLADGADPHHPAAIRWRDAWLGGGGSFVTTDYVTDETLTLLRVRLGLEAAESWWTLVEQSRRIRWEQLDPARCQQARAWLFRWRDQEFSFTDCTSFVVMRELRLQQALTSDHHFEIAGFERVPARKGRRSRR